MHKLCQRSPSPPQRGLILKAQTEDAHYPIIRTCSLARTKTTPHPEQHNTSGNLRQTVNTECPYFYLLHKICSTRTSRDIVIQRWDSRPCAQTCVFLHFCTALTLRCHCAGSLQLGGRGAEQVGTGKMQPQGCHPALSLSTPGSVPPEAPPRGLSGLPADHDRPRKEKKLHRCRGPGGDRAHPARLPVAGVDPSWNAAPLGLFPTAPSRRCAPPRPVRPSTPPPCP